MKKKKDKPQPFQIDEIAREIEETLDKLFPKGDKKRKFALALIGEMTSLFHKKLNSACEFYLRYKDNPKLLYSERLDLWQDFGLETRLDIAWLKAKSKGKDIDQKKWLKKYNDWLFKLAFKEVLEK